jgi:hypothetical protein
MVDGIGLETTFPNPNKISAFVWNTRRQNSSGFIVKVETTLLSIIVFIFVLFLKFNGYRGLNIPTHNDDGNSCL